MGDVGGAVDLRELVGVVEAEYPVSLQAELISELSVELAELLVVVVIGLLRLRPIEVLLGVHKVVVHPSACAVEKTLYFPPYALLIKGGTRVHNSIPQCVRGYLC